MAWQHEYDERVRNTLYQQFGYDVGNVYWVIQSTKTYYARFLESHMFIHPDGSKSVFTDAGRGDGIAAAIAACKGGRNDYVIVGSGTYALTAALALTGRSSLHLIAANGGGMDVGSPGAVILRQDGNYTAITMNAFCEVSGFQIENRSGYSAINVPANIGWSNIHHNLFKFSGSAGIDCVNYADGANWGAIHHNKFVQWTGTAARSCISIGDQSTAVTVANNDILCYGVGNVWDYGIYHLGIGGIVRDNFIGESGGPTSLWGGTITIAIEAGASTNVANNRLCVASGRGLNGGTANITFCDNRDGQAGGA
jgi:hypothetical protein